MWKMKLKGPLCCTPSFSFLFLYQSLLFSKFRVEPCFKSSRCFIALKSAEDPLLTEAFWFLSAIGIPFFIQALSGACDCLDSVLILDAFAILGFLLLCVRKAENELFKVFKITFARAVCYLHTVSFKEQLL